MKINKEFKKPLNWTIQRSKVIKSHVVEQDLVLRDNIRKWEKNNVSNVGKTDTMQGNAKDQIHTETMRWETETIKEDHHQEWRKKSQEGGKSPLPPREELARKSIEDTHLQVQVHQSLTHHHNLQTTTEEFTTGGKTREDKTVVAAGRWEKTRAGQTRRRKREETRKRRRTGENTKAGRQEEVTAQANSDLISWNYRYLFCSEYIIHFIIILQGLNWLHFPFLFLFLNKCNSGCGDQLNRNHHILLSILNCIE